MAGYSEVAPNHVMSENTFAYYMLRLVKVIACRVKANSNNIFSLQSEMKKSSDL